MAERKSGPVKPPVIDLTARPAAKPDAQGATAGTPKPASAGSGKTTPGAKTEAEKPAGEASKPVVAAAEATVAGTVTGPAAGAPVAAGDSEATAPSGDAETMRPAAPEPDSQPALSESEAPPTRATKSDPNPALAGKSAAADGPSAAPAMPPLRRGNGLGSALACGIGGAVVAIVLCYGIAWLGYWPASNDGRLAALDARLTATEKSNATGAAALADLDARFGVLQTNVAAKLAATGSSLTAMQGNIDKLQASGGDLAPVRDELKTLSARVDAVAAGASSADAGAIAANLATAQQSLTALTQRVSALDDRAGGTDSAIAALKTELGAAKAAIDQAAAAPSPKTIAAAMQLPLLISALDADFAAGRPFAADLTALESAVPEAHVPASLSGAAATGLPAAADVVAAFETRMPDIMAARPASTDSSWQGQLGDWVKGVLALRQEGAETGDSADAVLSRLEAAVNRHDFAGALTLLGQLPPPMQQAAGDVRPKLQSLADADSFLADLRKKALAPAAGVEQ